MSERSGSGGGGLKKTRNVCEPLLTKLNLTFFARRRYFYPAMLRSVVASDATYFSPTKTYSLAQNCVLVRVRFYGVLLFLVINNSQFHISVSFSIKSDGLDPLGGKNKNPSSGGGSSSNSNSNWVVKKQSVKIIHYMTMSSER